MSHRDDRGRRKQEKIAKQRARLAAEPILSEKKPRSVEPEKAEEMTVQWCFRLFDYQKDWRLGSLEHVGFCEVGEHIKDYSQRRWKDIRARGDRDHPIACSRLRIDVVN